VREQKGIRLFFLFLRCLFEKVCRERIVKTFRRVSKRLASTLSIIMQNCLLNKESLCTWDGKKKRGGDFFLLFKKKNQGFETTFL
jgi:hypothetical protein